jgi:hypothetical protein
MACNSCVEKLARRLVEHHGAKLDWIRALELAERGVERAESRKRKCRSCHSGRFAFLSNLWQRNPTAVFLTKRWIEYYLVKGFSDAKSKSMAKKLIKRIDMRLKKEHKLEEPMFLIERAREGVLFYRREPSRLMFELKRWVFRTNWKATLFWSVKLLSLRWIGLGHSPSYTQACAIGNCAKVVTGCAKLADPCELGTDCITTGCTVSGACNCPSALEHSVPDGLGCSVSCTSGGACGGCVKSVKCAGPTCSASCPGTCGYNCDVDYHWDGVACVPDVTVGKMVVQVM